MSIAAAREVLAPSVWRARRSAHEVRVDAWLAPHLDRRRRGQAHPVEDFLFTYYSFRPAHLRRWSPGAGVVLADAEGSFTGAPWCAVDGGIALRPPDERLSATAAWVSELLRRTAARPAGLGCFGMHEWAMVHGESAQDVRHAGWPLRLGPDVTSAVVETLGVRCSHFDAFRFFTPSARPFNVLQPTREAQLDLEQPGCLHATMDLYKWAYKLAPWIPAELVANCFALAREVRELDMKASPYDLSSLGYAPVRVETPAGRAQYAAAQRAFAARGGALRAELLAAIDLALTPARPTTPPPCIDHATVVHKL